MESSTPVREPYQILCLLSLHLHDTPSEEYDSTNTSKTSPSTTQSQTYTPLRTTHTPSSYNVTITSYQKIASTACPPTIPRTDLAQYFLNTLSPHSARGRLKKHATTIVKAELHNHMFAHHPEHFHLLPSILSPTTSYPLIAMSRCPIKNRLTPLAFLLSFRRKLRLPISPKTFLVSAVISYTTNLETTPSVANEETKNVLTTSLHKILPSPYLLLWHKPDTYIQTPH